MAGKVDIAAYERFNSSFGKFVENAAVKDSTIAKIDQFNLKGVTSLKAGKGDFRGNVFRDAGQIATNNSIRNEFRKAVAAIFKGEENIPHEVEAAMKKADFDGKGRPLTARRIRATLAQIKTLVNLEKVRNALNAQDWLSEAKFEVADAATRRQLESYADRLSDELCGAMRKLLLPDIRKGKAPSVEKMCAVLKEFTVKSDVILAMERDLRDNVGNLKAGSDDKYEDDDRLFAKVCGDARRRAFALALAKDDELANFFFSASATTDRAIENLFQAKEDIHAEANEIDMDNDNTVESDKLSQTVAPIITGLGNVRALYIMGMSRKDAVSELMRLSGVCFGKEIAMGKVSLLDVITVLSLTTVPGSKDILADFYRKLGKQVVDGTIRQEDTTRGSDWLYQRVLKEDIKRWMAVGARDGQSLMGSEALDRVLLERLNALLKNNGYNNMDDQIFSGEFKRGLV